ncbi:MAG TPA: hypothetical protein VHS05_09490 [Pyrinomonadaceae bacterium]|jgi:hypothetical protein|nr:hypothetical protein [Pyrinomonadaceae bacterium]
MMRVTGVGTVADPIDVLALQTSSGVIAAIMIATGGKAEIAAGMTVIRVTIATGVAAGKHS